MSLHDETYRNLLETVLANGQEREDRTGTGTISCFGVTSQYDLRQGFPLLTTKKVHYKSVFAELCWFMRGETNNNKLNRLGATIWDEWADKDGNLGPIYGKQWRNIERGVGNPDWYQHVDQLENLVNGMRETPNSRRLIVNAWNVAEIEDMALPPCHMMFQVYCHGGGFDLMLYQRSADLFLGVPFNIASYAGLMLVLGAMTGQRPCNFLHVMGDAHIYKNHVDQVKEQLSRSTMIPAPNVYLVWQNPDALDFEDIKPIDFIVEDYEPMSAIKAPVAV